MPAWPSEPGGGGGAVLSPTAAGPGVLGIRTGAGGGLFRCPEVRAVAPEGWQEEGLRLRELTEPRRLRAPAQLLPQRVLGTVGRCPGCPPFVPGPHPHRLHTPTADRCLQAAFFPWGFVVPRHVYITVRVLRGSVLFALLPCCTSPTRTRPRELLLRSGPTPQATCLGVVFFLLKANAC